MHLHLLFKWAKTVIFFPIAPDRLPNSLRTRRKKELTITTADSFLFCLFFYRRIKVEELDANIRCRAVLNFGHFFLLSSDCCCCLRCKIVASAGASNCKTDLSTCLFVHLSTCPLTAYFKTLKSLLNHVDESWSCAARPERSTMKGCFHPVNSRIARAELLVCTKHKENCWIRTGCCHSTPI